MPNYGRAANRGKRMTPVTAKKVKSAVKTGVSKVKSTVKTGVSKVKSAVRKGLPTSGRGRAAGRRRAK